MAHERWTKRMYDAVESSWLRGLRAQSRAQRGSAAQRILGTAAPRPGSPGKLDRTVAAGAER